MVKQGSVGTQLPARALSLQHFRHARVDAHTKPSSLCTIERQQPAFIPSLKSERRTCVADFNQDGRLDFATVGALTDTSIRVYINEGDAGQHRTIDLPTFNTASGIACGDVTGGRAKHVLVHHGRPPGANKSLPSKSDNIHRLTDLIPFTVDGDIDIVTVTRSGTTSPYVFEVLSYFNVGGLTPFTPERAGK